jgi:hypothetical protein
MAPLFPQHMFLYLPMNTLLFQLFPSHGIKQKKKIKNLPTRCKQDKVNI